MVTRQSRVGAAFGVADDFSLSEKARMFDAGTRTKRRKSGQRISLVASTAELSSARRDGH